MCWQSIMRLANAKPLHGIALTAFLVLSGCNLPAQIVWSPDGTRAAYCAGNTAVLLDQKGTVLQPLGASVGGFVWSADAKRLYFASIDQDAADNEEARPTPLHLEWLAPANPVASDPPDNLAADPATQSTTRLLATHPTTLPATQSSAEPKSTTVVSVLENDRATMLFRLPDVVIWHLQLSPDGQWLAAMARVNRSEGEDENQLFVFSLRRGILYELSQFCGLGTCFTSRSELAFMEASGVDDVGKLSGHLVKVKLDETAQTLTRQTLLDAILPLTGWMEPCPGGVMFTASPRLFPGPPTGGGAPIFKLFHYTCADGGLTVLADDVGELFDASPDGKRILFEKLTPPEPSATCPTVALVGAPAATQPGGIIRDDLSVMNANGSDPQVLRSLGDYAGTPTPPMWPAWRGNGEITFIAPAEQAKGLRVNNEDRRVLEVIQYRLTDKGTLEPIRALSSSWKPEDKPYLHNRSDKSK